MKFGFPDEWEAFSQRNQRFLERFPHLKIAFDRILVRTISGTTLADKIILFLGRLCLEDFMEIMLLAGNGYGYGALKLVRGLYERAVVTYYLVANPEKTVKFLDYSHLEKLKGISAWVEAYPDDPTGSKILGDVRTRFEEIRREFTTRTWSGLDFVSMAKTTGSLGKMLSEAYYHPLAHAHGTAQAVISRLIWSEEKGFELVGGAQPKQANKRTWL